MMEEAVKDGPGGGDVAQEFTPFLNETIGGHHGRAVFVATDEPPISSFYPSRL